MDLSEVVQFILILFPVFFFSLLLIPNILTFLLYLDRARFNIRTEREVLISIVGSGRTTRSIDLVLDLQFRELAIAEPSYDDHDLAVALQLKLDEGAEIESDGDSQENSNADHTCVSGPAKDEQAAPPANCTCLRCTDEIPHQQSFKAPCTHDFCFDCLADFFEATIGDEALYPPRCCGQEIPFESVQGLLNDRLQIRYREKKMEYDTEPNNRTYCHNTTCGSFIYADLIEDEAGLCLDCGRTTCTMCKRATHYGDCPSDEGTQRLLELAENRGWQRCYNAKCHRVVELSSGCNHITCVCGAQFCYICGSRWRTCTCPQYTHPSVAGDVRGQPAAVHRFYRPT
ncbi:hypothetical protein D6D18_10290 [Aureobasidium pullulans]|nr:hypothetical protein D6D18_10290 [Aureobasidium pullulans]